MLIRAKTPLRISFAGGGTDVPPYPEMEGGCVLNSTISKYAYGTLEPRADGEIHIKSLDYGLAVNYKVDEPPLYDGNLDLVKGAIASLLGESHLGFDIFLHCDAPPGSGLGSSSALVVTIVGLLKELRNLPLTDYEIAHLAYVIERREMGIPGGLQDQYAATFGGCNYIEFFGDRVIVNPLKLSQDISNELEHGLLLCYTGSARLSTHIIESQVEHYSESDTKTLACLRELKQLTVEMKNLLLRRRFNDFGELMHVEWETKKRLSDRISTPRIDELYAEARSSGAIGGKIAGAGGGGYLLLFCPFDQKYKVAERMKEIGCSITDFAFEYHGLQTWRVNGD